MRNPWKLTSFALASLLAVSIGNNFVPSASADAQPKMREALDSLRSAKNALEAATHDKGGHRAKALELTKSAIDQVQAGVKFDNRH
ncbi:MAG: hypothetical protein H7138_07740 [Myxococcales bacterium]|nr:hypothetical protein [Myxococcales bacterium]